MPSRTLGMITFQISSMIFNPFRLTFDTLDKNSNGVIEFREFLETMSVLRGDSMKHKLDFSFSLCDPDKDGKITHAELVRILRALCLAVESSRDGEQAQIVTDEIFATVDAVN